MLGSETVKYRKRTLAIYGKPPPHGLLEIGIFMKIRRLKEENHLRAESLVGVFNGVLGGSRNWNSWEPSSVLLQKGFLFWFCFRENCFPTSHLFIYG
jgi:hypothetical protein